MKAGIIFTGTGPILILTSYPSLSDPSLAAKLREKGIERYLAYELPVEQVKEVYGSHFETVVNDVQQKDDLRVLDYNGHHVFLNFDLRGLSQPELVG